LTPTGTLPSESKTTVAGTMHTIIVLVIIAMWAAWGYFHVNGMRLAARPPRAGSYILTMLWEWSVVAYVAWGISRGGTPLKTLIGGKWETAKDVFRDLAISVGFWITALVVLASTALAIHVPRASQSVRALLPQTRLEIVLWILTSLSAGICEEIIFRGYLQRQFCACSAPSRGAGWQTRDRHWGLWCAVWNSGRDAEEFATRHYGSRLA